MFRKILHLIGIIVFIVLSTLLTLMENTPHIVRVINAILFVFVLPGYSIRAAFFGFDNKMNHLEEILMVFSLSIATIIIGGVLQFLFQLKLNTINWITYISVVSILFSLILFVRSKDRLITRPNKVPKRFSWSQILYFIIAFLLTFAAIWFSRQGEATMPFNGYTQLWILPSKTTRLTVEIGITSYENIPQEYHIEVLLEDEIYTQQKNIQVNPQDTWKTEVTLPEDVASDEVIHVNLYLGQSEKVYRTVFLPIEKVNDI